MGMRTASEIWPLHNEWLKLYEEMATAPRHEDALRMSAIEEKTAAIPSQDKQDVCLKLSMAAGCCAAKEGGCDLLLAALSDLKRLAA